jgi:hypothetical protein
MVSRIQSEKRPVLDYEVYAIANALEVRIESLFKNDKH